MELHHLRYFIAVAEESSLRRAARRLLVSQPALSQQISDLEDELGFKLFTRNARGAELTAAGRVFLTGARALVAAKQAAEQAQEAAEGERGRFVIGSFGAAMVSLTGVLTRFRQQHPLVEITLLKMHNRAQVEAVLDGSIKLGIGFGFYSHVLKEDEREQVSTRLLLRSPVGIVLPKNRRLPKGVAAKLKDFRDEKFLAINPEHGFGYEEWLRGLCERLAGFQPDIAALADSAETLIEMVAAGRGVYVGSEIGFRLIEEAWRPVGDFYLLTEPESRLELFAIWKKRAQVEQIIWNFIDDVVAELTSLQPGKDWNHA
ncbi:MAG: LysR family transcriptional regulator [Verrucomicrobia bacterium]|nr:LysR family transcriptional regulator [Verrucomicrobiota bacterium]